MVHHGALSPGSCSGLCPDQLRQATWILLHRCHDVCHHLALRPRQSLAPCHAHRVRARREEFVDTPIRDIFGRRGSGLRRLLPFLRLRRRLLAGLELPLKHQPQGLHGTDRVLDGCLCHPQASSCIHLRPQQWVTGQIVEQTTALLLQLLPQESSRNLTFYPLPSQILQSTPWLSHIDRKQTTLREGLLLALRVRHQSCHCHLQPASFTDGSLVLRQLRGQVAEGRHSLASSMECMSVVTYLFRYFVACFFRSFVVSVFLSFLALSQLCFFCCSILCGFASFPASFLRCFVLSLCFSFT